MLVRDAMGDGLATASDLSRRTEGSEKLVEDLVLSYARGCFFGGWVDTATWWIAAALRSGTVRVAMARNAMNSTHQELVESRLDACLGAVAAGNVNPTVLGDWSTRVVRAATVFDPNFSESDEGV